MRLALFAAAALGFAALPASLSPALAQSGGSGSLTDQLVGPAPAPLVFPRPTEPDPALTRPSGEPQARPSGTEPPPVAGAPGDRRSAPSPAVARPATREVRPAPPKGRGPREAATPGSAPRPTTDATAPAATADRAEPTPAVAATLPELRPKQAEDRFEMMTRRQTELGKRLQRSICSNC